MSRDDDARAASPIGVLGGTFDPIHRAHLALGRAARDAFGLAEVRFVPSARPPHRDAPTASAADRLAMVEAAIADEVGFVADARELRRATPSWTIDTLESLRAEVGTDRPIVLLLGDDAFALLHTWHRWRDVIDAAHLAIAVRTAASTPPDPAAGARTDVGGRSSAHVPTGAEFSTGEGFSTAARAVPLPDAAPSFASRLDPAVAHEWARRETADPAHLRATPAGRMCRLPFDPMPVSATTIRAQLAVGERPGHLLPDAVLDYIESRHLYASTHAR